MEGEREGEVEGGREGGRGKERGEKQRRRKCVRRKGDGERKGVLVISKGSYPFIMIGHLT